ncbi:MAG: hypothetical protein ACM3PC_13305 [Deltaproteobacteria bacterium]
MIPIVDLSNGAVSDRPSSTPTLDLPQDFDRTAASAEVDVHSRVRYLTSDGKKVVKPALQRPLSWRVHGEDCLVSEGATAATVESPANYKLFTVE